MAMTSHLKQDRIIVFAILETKLTYSCFHLHRLFQHQTFEPVLLHLHQAVTHLLLSFNLYKVSGLDRFNQKNLYLAFLP